jgi:hypothetical protein
MQDIQPDTSRGPSPFSFSAGAYSSGDWPSVQAGYSFSGVLRGVGIGRFVAVPFAWDADTGELTVYRRMRLDISFGGGLSIPGRLRSPWFDSIYRQTLINAGSLEHAGSERVDTASGPVFAHNDREAWRADGADLLILAGDDFVDTMLDDFATIKFEQGYLTTVVAAGSWTTAQIKDYIQNAYDTWDPVPSFVLFVGDHPELPGYNYDGMNSDNRYCCVDGPDYMCDIFRGRFPTPTDFMPVVSEKTLAYEFDPPVQESFWNSVLCAGYFQDDNNDGVADRWFLFTCETVRDTYANLYGKTVEREYCTNSTHALPWFYRPDLPSAGQQVPSDITWDGDAEGISAAINSGVFLVQHRDHGMVSGWADPYYTTSHLSSLANGDLTPVVFSINCLTGQFSSDCFAEHLFRMQGGAAAVFAAVDVSYSYFNDYLCYGMYHSFNDEYASPPAVYTDPSGNYLAGQVLMGGQLEMQAAAPFNPYGSWEAYAETTWDLFHVFGDPTMDIRTAVPAVLSVTAPESLPEGSGQAQFTISSGGAPVEGALVCLRKPDEEIYARGFTGAAGDVVLTFPALAQATEMPWMVTAHDCMPSTGAVNGTGIEGGHGGPVSFAAGRPFPNPAPALVSIPVTLAVPGDVVLMAFDISGRLVQQSIFTGLAAGESILTWQASAGLPPGIYLIEIGFPDGSGSTLRAVLTD